METCWPLLEIVKHDCNSSKRMLKSVVMAKASERSTWEVCVFAVLLFVA